MLNLKNLLKTKRRSENTGTPYLAHFSFAQYLKEDCHYLPDNYERILSNISISFCATGRADAAPEVTGG